MARKATRKPVTKKATTRKATAGKQTAGIKLLSSTSKGKTTNTRRPPNNPDVSNEQ